MKTLFAMALALGLAIAAQATDKKSGKSAADLPAKRDDGWVSRHDGFVDIAKKGDVDLVFFGDSITDGWRDTGLAIWEKNFTPLKAVNFGISSDLTQHVLWRVHNGELTGLKPKVVVLMIGTNNLGSNTDDEIAKGIKAIVEEIHAQVPTTKVLLLGVFPRGDSRGDTRGDPTKPPPISNASTPNSRRSMMAGRRSNIWTSAPSFWTTAARCPYPSCRTASTPPPKVIKSGPTPSSRPSPSCSNNRGRIADWDPASIYETAESRNSVWTGAPACRTGAKVRRWIGLGPCCARAARCSGVP